MPSVLSNSADDQPPQNKIPSSENTGSALISARLRTRSRNLGLHTAPLGVDARGCVVVLVKTVAAGSDIRGGSRVVGVRDTFVEVPGSGWLRWDPGCVH